VVGIDLIAATNLVLHQEILFECISIMMRCVFGEHG
jgi:hypothetical protein